MFKKEYAELIKVAEKIAGSFNFPKLEIKELPSSILGYADIENNTIVLCSNGIKSDYNEALDTLGHELAHFTSFAMFGYNNILDHGAEFRAICQLLGVKPVQRQDQAYKLKTYYIYHNRDLNKSESVSKSVHNRIQASKHSVWSADQWVKVLSLTKNEIHAMI